MRPTGPWCDQRDRGATNDTGGRQADSSQGRPARQARPASQQANQASEAASLARLASQARWPASQPALPEHADGRVGGRAFEHLSSLRRPALRAPPGGRARPAAFVEPPPHSVESTARARGRAGGQGGRAPEHVSSLRRPALRASSSCAHTQLRIACTNGAKRFPGQGFSNDELTPPTSDICIYT